MRQTTPEETVPAVQEPRQTVTWERALTALYLEAPAAVVDDVNKIVRAEMARRAEAIADLRAACKLAVDFHSADTQAFVAQYGAGMGTKQLCDRLRAAIAKAEGR